MDDNEITPHLQCDIELAVSGPNDTAINKWVADALRKLATQIEEDNLGTGFHDVTDRVGKKLGTVYLNHEDEL